MKKINLSVIDPYLWVNGLFAGILILVFVYSAVFSPLKNNYPIHSQSELISSSPSQSTGLSRAFSLIVRGKLTEAKAMNPNSFRVFAFFIIQLGMRLFLLMYCKKIDSIDRNAVITTDSIISAGMFILFFEPFFEELFFN